MLNSCSEPAADIESEKAAAQDSGIISISSTQFQKSGFELGKLEMRNFQNFIQATGSIHLPEKNKSAVSSFVGGTVGGVDLIHGQWVKKGQRLFSISNPELISWQQDYLVLNSEIEYQQGEYERQKQLTEENISARKNLKKAESVLNISKARVAGLSKKLTMIGINPDNVSTDNLTSSLPIYAPSSGYISEINVKRGMFLDPFKTALEISNTNHLHMELKVLEKDIPKIKNGQHIRYSLQDDPNRKYKATIYLIEKLVGDNRMINVHCHLEDEEEKSLIPGMFVTAEIALDEREDFGLPEEAVVLFDSKHYILEQLEGGKYDFDQKMVEVGINQDGYYQLLNTSELNSDATYLTKGAYYLILGESQEHSH